MKSVFLIIGFLCMSAAVLDAKTENRWCGTKGIEQTKYAIHVNKEHMKDQPIRQLSNDHLNTDIGEIAVIEGSKTTLIEPNPFDLKGKRITFTRTTDGSYNMKVSNGSVAGNQGQSVTMEDDDSREFIFQNGFSFPFYDTTFTSVFLNSDGNLTFNVGDKEISERGIFRALTGPPRIFPFFKDLNAETGGQVKVLQTSTLFRVTWVNVPEFGTSKSNTVQVDLQKNGTIVFNLAPSIQTQDPIIGISQGNANPADSKLIDFTKTKTLKNVDTAIAERFNTQRTLDLVALVQEFHLTHPQIFDFVVIFTDRGYIQLIAPGAFAFFLHTSNSIKGIGIDQFDFSSQFGSPKLQGLLMMDNINKYPDDPNEDFLGTNSTLEVMGQEGGHRWMAFPSAIINGVQSRDFLGRDLAHWSFFMDSDASVMEGNDIVDNGNGTFTTVAATETFSKLDRYLMGFLGKGGVPPFFFVQTTAGVGDPGDAPRVGVTFSGTRVNVNIGQIIQAEGPRIPPVGKSQKKFREAFIFFVTPGTGGPDPAQLAQVDLIRRTWQTFFKQKTNGKGRLDTTLP